MSQNDRILAYLRLNNRLCSFAPYEWEPAIKRPAARIDDLKKRGHEITSHQCLNHPGKTAGHVVYELVTADQTSLF